MNTTTTTTPRNRFQKGIRAAFPVAMAALAVTGVMTLSTPGADVVAKPRITATPGHGSATAQYPGDMTTGQAQGGHRARTAGDIAAPGTDHRASDVHRLGDAASQRSRDTGVPVPRKRDFDEVYGSENEMEEQAEAAQNGTLGRASTTTVMTNHGGAVQTSPHIYLVFWGSSWTTSSGDPYGVANRLHYFYSGLGGSTWANTLKQYTSSYGSFTNPTGQYRGWLRDTTAIPTNPTQAQIAAVAARAASTVGDYSYNAQYVVAMPWGKLDTISASGGACAWHYYTRLSSSSWITYTALPYTPYVDQVDKAKYGVTCGGGRVTGGVLDGVTINAAHEYAETVTDPSASTWYDASGVQGEVGDKCSWINLHNQTMANGYTFPIQPNWSNSYFRAYGNGCPL